MDLHLNITYNILLFIFSAVVVWILCNKLSEIVDTIDLQFNLGAAFGGTIMLAIITNLPEIAIVFNGALNGRQYRLSSRKYFRRYCNTIYLIDFI